MNKNPYLNAAAATIYIIAISLLMSWGTNRVSGPDTFMAPIAVMSLFTLSAAVMGYVFCYTPIMMYFDGKKKEAANLFLQTVGLFSIVTLLFLTLLFTGVFQ